MSEISPLYLNMINRIEAVENVTQAQKTRQVQSVETVTANESEEMISFQEILEEGIEAIQGDSSHSERLDLLGVLDRSVAGETLNLTELSNDMLQTSSGRNVLQSLVDGQFSSLVMNPDQEKETSNVMELLREDKEEDSSAEMEQLIQKMQEVLDIIKTSE